MDRSGTSSLSMTPAEPCCDPFVRPASSKSACMKAMFEKPAASSRSHTNRGDRRGGNRCTACTIDRKVEAEEKAEACGLFASDDSAVVRLPTGETATAAPAQPDSAKTPDKVRHRDVDGYQPRQMLPRSTAAARPASRPASSIRPDEADEVSEAELVGERRSRPGQVIAVPKPPADDGREHDFVNVYSARPDATGREHRSKACRASTWNNDMILVLASRGPDGGPRGASSTTSIHPVTPIYVPGMPLETWYWRPTDCCSPTRQSTFLA